MDPFELSTVATLLDGQPPEAVLAWATARYPRVALAVGFGAEGLVLVDLVARHRLRVDLFTLDTGLLFPETYALWRRVEARYGRVIRAVRPAQGVAEQATAHGPALWGRAPTQCCALRKVEPLRRHLAGYDAWVTAIRREQTADRAGAAAVEWDAKFGLVKANPLVAWSASEVADYVRVNDVPVNPLHAAGYASIGCEPCTTPVAHGEDPRAGRWRGIARTECGLHVRDGRRSHLESTETPTPAFAGTEGLNR